MARREREILELLQVKAVLEREHGAAPMVVLYCRF
jgi:hypothetical protein